MQASLYFTAIAKRSLKGLVIQRSYGNGLLKLLKDSLSQGKGDFFWAVFFVVEALVRSPVCVCVRKQTDQTL